MTCKHRVMAMWYVTSVPLRKLPRIMSVCGQCGTAIEYLVIRRKRIVARYQIKRGPKP